MKKKLKPIIPLIFPWNVDGISPNTATPTLSNLHRKPPIILPSTLFRSELPPLDHNKTDKEPVYEFLCWSVCYRMHSKDFLPENASFCKKTWEIVAYMVITGKGNSGPNIWPKTPYMVITGKGNSGPNIWPKTPN